jgi:hypothetical protein
MEGRSRYDLDRFSQLSALLAGRGINRLERQLDPRLPEIKNMKTYAIIVLLAAVGFNAHAQTGPAWASTAGKITNNGSVTVKSSSGASTYNAVKNPVGAVAKTNQSAVTQPPTVIIQATAGGAAAPRQCQPKLVQSTVMPSCGAGYTSVWQESGKGCTQASTFNIDGTTWSFGQVTGQNAAYHGFMNDNDTRVPGGGAGPVGLSMTCVYVSSQYDYSANLCCK